MAYKFTHPDSNRPGELDKRYRITVMLVATRRPKYWTLHCNYCGLKIGEFSGNLVALTDTADADSPADFAPPPFIIRCRGKYCNFWYEILSLSP